jgi:hypothetical protein
MWDNLSSLPFGFWVVIALLAGGAVKAIQNVKDGTGIPVLAVLFTVAVWYVGDALYNDYANTLARIFPSYLLQNAWFELAWFLVVFLVATPSMHHWFNKRCLRRGSGAMRMFVHGVDEPRFQRQLEFLFKGCVSLWLLLGVAAAIRLQGEVGHYFFPYWGYKAEPWGRGRMGGGIDALLSAAFYFQLLVSGIFGVVAALATDRKTRRAAILFCLLAWPYFILDRTRNTMLAAVIPGLISWALLRIRGSMLKRALVLGAFFLVINAWFEFVIANRMDLTITQALQQKGFSLTNKEKARHLGLNMFEELCWVNVLLEEGTLHPSWGGRYFAEAVNFIPRVIWPGKPTIGVDYAIARGQGGGTASDAGITATVSTGVVGQGEVNFGRILGPVAAALLMSFWVACLARLDLNIQKLGYLPLYGTGLILTFNLGRDITLITLYPFVFGLFAVGWMSRNQRSLPAPPAPIQQPGTIPRRGMRAQGNKTKRPAHPAVSRSRRFARRQ